MDYNLNPAEGERRALIGFVPQYMIAADLVYSLLLEGTFEWIKITDPDAGRVDDIQIASTGRIDAYQVKWSETIDSITFNQLISDKKEKNKKIKPNLIFQLADGWSKLLELYPDRQIFVHLISRDVPSSSAVIPLDDLPPKDDHLQGFLRECFYNKSWLEQGLSSVPKGWENALSKLKLASGLSQQIQFEGFIKACIFDLQYQLPSAKLNKTREEIRRIKDTEHIFRYLMKSAGGEKRIIEITKTELLDQLGWKNRFKFYFKHEFWVDEKLYQPIVETVAEFESSIRSFSCGYLALIGTPGSGKSTTLTQSLRYKKGYRIIRYYAYVPEDLRIGRGEAINFLHDLVIALKKQGIYGQYKSQSESLEELREQLGTQLVELKERWGNDGIKTLILIDGLDHIEREQSPERTLLMDLPSPEAIPDGTIIILGSQKLNLIGLSSRIQVHLEESGRTINMRPLQPQSIINIIDSVDFSIKLSYPQKEQIIQLSNGHPLALSYLLKKLQTINNFDQINVILNSANPYQGHIEQDYVIYWRTLEDDMEIKNLLALISRLRGAINLVDVSSWVGEAIVRRFIKQAQHYFRYESEIQWYFFHNSFRQFILNKTGRNLFGKTDESHHRNYHKQLANYAASTSMDNPWSWEQLYHRACAEEWKTVLQLGTQKNLRAQFFSLRPFKDIIDDITFCMKAARVEQDGLAIIRAFLIETELNERHDHIKDLDLPRLIYELNGIEESLIYVFKDRDLNISKINALKFCEFLISKGELEASRLIFNNAEPLDLLSGSKAMDTIQDGNKELLKAWASVSHYFLSFDQIIKSINQLQIDTSRSNYYNDPEEMLKRIQRSIFIALVNSVSKSQDFDKILELRDLILSCEYVQDITIRIDINICLENKDKNQALLALERIILEVEQYKDEISDEEKVLIAEFLFRLKNDEFAAHQWIKDIPQPSHFSEEDFGHNWKNLSPFIQRIRFNRLLTALGKQVSFIEAVPDLKEDKKRGGVLFERMIVLIANLWGRAWGGNLIKATEVQREIQPAIVFFNRSYEETKDWFPWYELRNAKSDYFTFLIRAVSAHGLDCLINLGEILENQWNQETSWKYWQNDIKRHISLELFRLGDSITNLVKRLSLIEEKMDGWDDLYTRVQECFDQAMAWLEAQEPQRARTLLPKMLATSFGIYHDKDDQFHFWVKWLTKINNVQTQGNEERIRRFVGTLVVLEHARHGANPQEAARDLIETIALWNPEYAIQMRSWLMEKKALKYIVGIEGILTAALKTSEPPIEVILNIIQHFIIPFQESNDSTLAKLIASKCYSCRGEREARKYLESLLSTIEVKAFPSLRQSWMVGLIEGIREANFDSSWLESKIPEKPKIINYSGEPTIKIKSGESLTVEDVILRIHSFGTFIQLLESVVEVKYFNWDKVVGLFINSLNSEQIDILDKCLQKFDPGPKLLMQFAKRLKSIGYINEAHNKAELALKHSSPSGWSRKYDGGSRLYAVQLLVELDGTKGRENAYNLLVNDYLSETRYPETFLFNLNNLIPVLFEKPPIEAIWNELEEHIYQLHDFSCAEEFPPYPSVDSVKSSFTDILFKLLEIDSNIPVAEMREEVHQAICILIKNETANSQVSLLIDNLLKGNETSQVIALATLRSCTDLNHKFVCMFKSQIECLCNSPTMIVRQIAINLALELKIKPQKFNKALPLTYNLELPDLVMSDWMLPLESLQKGEPFPDTYDPIEMIRPFQDHLERLSRYTDIPLQNLVARIITLMQTLSPSENWNKKAEKDLQTWLKSVELRLTFYRLRPVVTLRALGYVIAELADADVIKGKLLAKAQHDICLYDPILSIIQPISRPVEIDLPSVEEMELYSNKDWLNTGHESLPLIKGNLNDGRIILGELSRVVHIDWKLPSEYRFSMVCHPEWPEHEEISDASEFFPYKSKWHASDYPYLEEAFKIPSTIIYGNSLQIELGRSEWLAINPIIPLHIGWNQTPNGIFRWVDINGNIMVESIWWKDGPIHRYPPRYHEICSEGWLVVASKEAVDLILKCTGEVIRLNLISRQHGKENSNGLLKSHVCKRIGLK